MENALVPFLSSFFILLREGFEAMLIAVLVFMYLDKVKAKNKRPAVFWGIAAGIVASMFVALSFKKIAGITMYVVPFPLGRLDMARKTHLDVAVAHDGPGTGTVVLYVGAGWVRPREKSKIRIIGFHGWCILENPISPPGRKTQNPHFATSPMAVTGPAPQLPGST